MRQANGKGSHYSHLEIGREVMNSLTRVAKDTLVIEVYERSNDNALPKRVLPRRDNRHGLPPHNDIEL